MSKINSKNFFLVTFTFCFLFITNVLLAQETPLKYADEFTTKGGATFSIFLDDNNDLTTAVFFTDKENQLLFIDFEALGEEVSEISITNNQAIISTEDVSLLPTNTIYEIDLKNYKSGQQYKISLHTSFGILTQTFTIKK